MRSALGKLNISSAVNKKCDGKFGEFNGSPCSEIAVGPDQRHGALFMGSFAQQVVMVAKSLGCGSKYFQSDAFRFKIYPSLSREFAHDFHEELIRLNDKNIMSCPSHPIVHQKVGRPYPLAEHARFRHRRLTNNKACDRHFDLLRSTENRARSRRRRRGETAGDNSQRCSITVM